MPNINIPVDPDLHRRLRVAAAERDMRMQAAVIQAIEQWVQRQESTS